MVVLAVPLRADDEVQYSRPIVNILIIGNEITGENVILRELLVREGTVPTQEALDQSRKRLLNLFLFNRVELYLVQQNEEADILIVEVTEQWYFYPIPTFSSHARAW